MEKLPVNEERLEEAGKALEELLDIMTKLKESGLLDMMKAMIERYEDLMTYMAQDRRLFKAMVMVEGALNGIEDADAAKLKYASMGLSQCSTKALEEVMDKGVEPVGLMGLLKALRDPDVMYGLGLMIAMAKSIGRCFRENMEKMKQMK